MDDYLAGAVGVFFGLYPAKKRRVWIQLMRCATSSSAKRWSVDKDNEK